MGRKDSRDKLKMYTDVDTDKSLLHNVFDSEKEKEDELPTPVPRGFEQLVSQKEDTVDFKIPKIINSLLPDDNDTENDITLSPKKLNVGQSKVKKETVFEKRNNNSNVSDKELDLTRGIKGNTVDIEKNNSVSNYQEQLSEPKLISEVPTPTPSTLPTSISSLKEEMQKQGYDVEKPLSVINPEMSRVERRKNKKNKTKNLTPTDTDNLINEKPLVEKEKVLEYSSNKKETKTVKTDKTVDTPKKETTHKVDLEKDNKIVSLKNENSDDKKPIIDYDYWDKDLGFTFTIADDVKSILPMIMYTILTIGTTTGIYYVCRLLDSM